MDVTRFIMCDERAVWFGFATECNMRMEMRQDSFWRLGDRIPIGSPYPVYVERQMYPSKQSLPILGFERFDDGAAFEEGDRLRALIPISGVCVKSTLPGTTDASELKAGGLTDYAFIAALAHRTEHEYLCSGVTALATRPSPGRSSWVDWEPLVTSHQSAARWVRREVSLDQFGRGNSCLIETPVRWDTR